MRHTLDTVPTMLAPPRLLALSLGFLVAVGMAACGDDPPPDDDGGQCQAGEPGGGRSCECVGNDCVCPASGDCAIYCVDQCDLQCAGSGNCDFLCDDACDASCTGSGNCQVEVEQGSTVRCTGSGDCDVLCHGDCIVECPGSGTCTAKCAPGATCDISFKSCSGKVEDCPDNTSVCNGSCS